MKKLTTVIISALFHILSIGIVSAQTTFTDVSQEAGITGQGVNSMAVV